MTVTGLFDPDLSGLALLPHLSAFLARLCMSLIVIYVQLTSPAAVLYKFIQPCFSFQLPLVRSTPATLVIRTLHMVPSIRQSDRPLLPWVPSIYSPSDKSPRPPHPNRPFTALRPPASQHCLRPGHPTAYLLSTSLLSYLPRLGSGKIDNDKEP